MASKESMAAKKIQRRKVENEFSHAIASFLTVIGLNALSLILCVL